MNLQESIRRILREETESSKYTKSIQGILDYFKNEDCVCDIDMWYDDEDDIYLVYLVFGTEELDDKFTSDGKFGYVRKKQKEVEETIKSYLPIKNIRVGSYGTPHCGWKSLNESEDNREKKIQKNLKTIRQLLDTINLKGLCEMWVEYNPEDGDYEIRSKTRKGHFDRDHIVQELKYIEDTLKSWGLKTYVFAPWPVENCEDEVESLNESEEKKSRLLSNIEKNGLYEVISSTGLHINEIEQKVGQLSREVLERFIKDVVKEHFQVIDDDGKTYIIYLEDYPYDVVPIGNSDYVEQLRVIDNKLIFVVVLYDEDEYGDQEFSSEELTPSKNLLYMNIYEIAEQLGFLLSKGRI